MTAPFRIETTVDRDDGTTSEGFRQYLGRLLKMIPAEVVALYLIGSGLIPLDQSLGSAVWALICLVLVVLVRRYGTCDPENAKPPQWAAVAISSVAFVIWVYTLGGPFANYGLYVPWIGSLAVLVWSFVVPIFYKGAILN